MEKANCIVNLGGDAGNQVPKYDVTPSEVAVLRAIHGDDAVHSIVIDGDVDVTQKQDRDRLNFIYGKSRGGDDSGEPVMRQLFPGVGARLFEKFSELGLDKSQMKTKKQAQQERDDATDEADEAARTLGEVPVDPKVAAAAKKDIAADVKKGQKGKGERSPRSSATGTGLLGAEDGADPRPPIGKGGAGSLGIFGGVDGQGTPATLVEPKHVPEEPEDDGGIGDMPDEHSNARKGGPKHGR